MPKLNEQLLQFIWRHKLLNPLPLITTQGSKLEVLKMGEWNLDSGPDFFNAQIRLNSLVLVGNIEVHVKTSDWLKHKHQHDKNYDNIILHVVYEHDIELQQNKNNQVEVLELKHVISEYTLNTYNLLCTTKNKLACNDALRSVNELKFISWIERMTIERLEEKTKRIELIFTQNNGDYAQSFYTLLLRNFGFKVNGLPFELIAKQLPLTLLLKHADSLIQLEALLLGISGLLDDQFENKYIQTLQNEFQYLRNKYNFIPLQKELFKFSKMRPANFPNLRLVQLAKLIYTTPQLFTQPQHYTDYQQLETALQISLTGYWKNHYTLDGETQSKLINFGKTSIENIMINTLAPFFFFYSKKTGNHQFMEAALQLLEGCQFEINTKTKLFIAKKNALTTSANSQGLINLYDNYCIYKNCLKCGIAASILKSN